MVPMTNELHELLTHVGYSSRPQQEKLFALLTGDNPNGVIVQAGTGTGKSLAVLAAAVAAYRATGIQSLIVTPTRVLMDQYMASDAPATAECFDLSITELRGKRWYSCERSFDLMDEGQIGCMGKDADCSLPKWRRGQGFESARIDEDVEPYECGYQAAKHAASMAQIVVTNSDFWIINDRVLPEPVFHREGAVFVDEAHQLEPKLKDYAGRSVTVKELKRHYLAVGARLAKLLEVYQNGNADRIHPHVIDAIQACWNRGPGEKHPQTGELIKTDRGLEIQEGLGKMLMRLTGEGKSENCIVWSDGWSLKLDWIDIAPSAAELLNARPFHLVSATIPGSMPAALGVLDARVADVGHPFDYAKQGTLRISTTNGAFKYASSPANFEARIAELQEEIEKTKGGVLLLFSSFKDLEQVYWAIRDDLQRAGRTVLRQNDEVAKLSNEQLAAAFKADGKAVLFGSESFATGFDVPGDALEMVGIWKLPYPGKDPVTEAIMKRFYPRYRDMMLTRIVQAVGRLIRTESDRGRVFIADSRARDFISSRDLMVRHLSDFGVG